MMQYSRFSVLLTVLIFASTSFLQANIRPGQALFSGCSDTTNPPFTDQQFNWGIGMNMERFEDDEDQLPDVDTFTSRNITRNYHNIYTPGESNFVQAAARIFHNACVRTGSSPTSEASGIMGLLQSYPFNLLFRTTGLDIPEASLENELSITSFVTYMKSLLEAEFIFTDDDADFATGAYDVLNNNYGGYPTSGDSIILINSLLGLDNQVFVPQLNAGETFTGFNFTSGHNVTVTIPEGQTLRELEERFGNFRTQVLLERTATGNVYTNGTLTVTSYFIPLGSSTTYQVGSFSANLNTLLSPNGLTTAQELIDSTQADFSFSPSGTPVDPSASGFGSFTTDDVYVIFRLVNEHYNP